MNRLRFFFPGLLVVLSLNVAHAQTNGKKPVKVRYEGETFLAGQVGNGMISKKRLDSLIRLPLASRDSLGRLQPVTGFKLTWAELALYEDSTGRPMILADYYETFSDDEEHTVPQPWLDLILERSKPGDTLRFSHVKAMMPLPVLQTDTSGADSLKIGEVIEEVAPENSDTADALSKKAKPYYYRSRDLQLIVTD